VLVMNRKAVPTDWSMETATVSDFKLTEVNWIHF